MTCTLLQGVYLLHARLRPSSACNSLTTSPSGDSSSRDHGDGATAEHSDSTPHAEENATSLPTPTATLRPLLCYTAPTGQTTLYEPADATAQPGTVRGLEGKPALQGLLECFAGQLLWLQARQHRAASRGATSAAMVEQDASSRLAWQTLPLAENAVYVQVPTPGYVRYCHDALRRYYGDPAATATRAETGHVGLAAMQTELQRVGALPFVDEVRYYAERVGSQSNAQGGNAAYDYGYAFVLDARAGALPETDGVVVCVLAHAPAFNFARGVVLQLLPGLCEALHEARRTPCVSEWPLWLSHLLDERLCGVRGLTQTRHAVQGLRPGEVVTLKLPPLRDRSTSSQNTVNLTPLRRPALELHPYLDTPLAVLLASFSYTALRVLHTVMLQEGRVFVVGVTAQHASACVVAAPALLSPIQYCGTLLPHLPSAHALRSGWLDCLLTPSTAAAPRETAHAACDGFVIGITADLVSHVVLRCNAVLGVAPVTVYVADARTGTVGIIAVESLRAVLQERRVTAPDTAPSWVMTCDGVRVTHSTALSLQRRLVSRAADSTGRLSLLPHDARLQTALKRSLHREQRLGFRAVVHLLAKRAWRREQMLRQSELAPWLRRARRHRPHPTTPVSPCVLIGTPRAQRYGVESAGDDASHDTTSYDGAASPSSRTDGDAATDQKFAASSTDDDEDEDEDNNEPPPRATTTAPTCPVEEGLCLESVHAAVLQYNTQLIGNYRAAVRSMTAYGAPKDVVVAGNSVSGSSTTYPTPDVNHQSDLRLYLRPVLEPSAEASRHAFTRGHSFQQFMAALWCAEEVGLARVLRGDCVGATAKSDVSGRALTHNPYLCHPRLVLLLCYFYTRLIMLAPSFYAELAGWDGVHGVTALLQRTRQPITPVSHFILSRLVGEKGDVAERARKTGSGRTSVKGILHKAKKMVQKLGVSGKPGHVAEWVGLEGVVQGMPGTPVALGWKCTESRTSSRSDVAGHEPHAPTRCATRVNDLVRPTTTASRERDAVARAALLLCRPLSLDVVHQFASYHDLLDPRRDTVYTRYRDDVMGQSEVWAGAAQLCAAHVGVWRCGMRRVAPEPQRRPVDTPVATCTTQRAASQHDSACTTPRPATAPFRPLTLDELWATGSPVQTPLTCSAATAVADTAAPPIATTQTKGEGADTTGVRAPTPCAGDVDWGNFTSGVPEDYVAAASAAPAQTTWWTPSPTPRDLLEELFGPSPRA